MIWQQWYGNNGLMNGSVNPFDGQYKLELELDPFGQI